MKAGVCVSEWPALPRPPPTQASPRACSGPAALLPPLILGGMHSQSTGPGCQHTASPRLQAPPALLPGPKPQKCRPRFQSLPATQAASRSHSHGGQGPLRHTDPQAARASQRPPALPRPPPTQARPRACSGPAALLPPLILGGMHSQSTGPGCQHTASPRLQAPPALLGPPNPEYQPTSKHVPQPNQWQILNWHGARRLVQCSQGLSINFERAGRAGSSKH
jgi:hypothetical protein